jgi:predicted HAD superfamily Cof-like phosphohydrolase
MHAAVEYLNEAIHQAEDEFLAKKMAENKISPEIDELVDWLRLTPEEAADERTRWILGFDSK